MIPPAGTSTGSSGSGHAATTAPGGGSGPLRVGIVGGGQLARMLCEAASALAISTVVLAERADDAATGIANATLVGHPRDPTALKELSAACDVVTFDHEQVDLELVRGLVASGVTVRPGPETLTLTVDKAAMRQTLSSAGIPCPAFSVLPMGRDARRRALEGFAERHGWPLVLKAASGGYDGRGVWTVRDGGEAGECITAAERAGTQLLVEEWVDIRHEVAVMVARRPGGDQVIWPPVETAQVQEVCREILVPGNLPADVAAQAERLALRVGALVRAVGVLAVELFVTAGGLLVNELAARPHNSGHWSIEGSETSQFENHLRAVLDLPLGRTDPVAPQVATVNVFGGPDGQDPARSLDRALEVPGAHVHLYGKQARPDRKLGHVTVRGDDPRTVRDRAWEAAGQLGTPVPPAPDTS